MTSNAVKKQQRLQQGITGTLGLVAQWPGSGEELKVKVRVLLHSGSARYVKIYSAHYLARPWFTNAK